VKTLHMSSQVEQIKSKIDIVSLIGSYIKLEKAGSNFKGRCPFHNEKTPSFFVSPERGNYYCFGCHAKGDIFTFVQEFEGLDFIGSLRLLADRAGIKIEKFESGQKGEKEKLLSIMEQAVIFYQNNFDTFEPAKSYMKNRGIKDESISSFRIGYAPLGWRSLFDHLSSKNISPEDMLSAGLIKKKDNSNSYYDVFRGRIVFPISDTSGRVVAFSGRILVPDDKSPKYLNSPDTLLFNKSEIIFGLDKAKNEIKIKDYSILVEGQMDLVMLHQIGIKNAVASSGTAITESHIINLQRRSNRIIMFFDADNAGFSASNKTTQMAFISFGMEVKLAQLPKGKDPADIIKESPEAIKDILKNSKNIVDFYMDTIISENLKPQDLGREIQNNVFPYIAAFSGDIEKANFIKSISFKTSIKEEALWNDFKKFTKNIKFTQKQDNLIKSRADSIEKRIFGIILWSKDKSNSGVDTVKFFEKLNVILGKDKVDKLLIDFEKDKDSILFETELIYGGSINLENDLEELILGLEEESLKNKFSQAMNLLQKAERDKDKNNINKYLEECRSLSQKINTLKYKYEKKQ